METCPLRRENVPCTSRPLPFSAGSHTVFGIVTVIGCADVRPKISPSNPEPAPPTAFRSAAGAELTPNCGHSDETKRNQFRIKF